jgi:spore coat protein A
LPSVLRTIHPIPESAVVKSRLMILREYMDRNRKRMLMPLNGTRWHEPVTERP